MRTSIPSARHYRLIDLERRETGPRWYSPGSTPMDARIAGTARTSPRLLAEIVPPLNSPAARRKDYDTTGP